MRKTCKRKANSSSDFLKSGSYCSQNCDTPAPAPIVDHLCIRPLLCQGCQNIFTSSSQFHAGSRTVQNIAPVPVQEILFLTVQFRFRFKTFQKFGLRFGSGSVAPKFNGSVQVHRFEILKVRFRFIDFKFKRFRFGLDSPKKSGFYRFGFGSTP